MRKNLTKRVLLNGFWLSVLLHLFLFLSFTTVIILQPDKEKKPPQLYVSSYVYKGQINPVTPSSTKASMPLKQKPHSPESERESQQQEKAIPTATQTIHKTSIMAATRAVLQQYQRNALSQVKEEDPIYLIGDENTVADPLIKLMGRALSAHFSYPPVAGELGIKGRVIVGLTLHPQGHFSDVQIIRSSENADLDAAALYAVNSAPNVNGADRFLSQPKHFVIGFVFR